MGLVALVKHGGVFPVRSLPPLSTAIRRYPCRFPVDKPLSSRSCNYFLQVFHVLKLSCNCGRIPFNQSICSQNVTSTIPAVQRKGICSFYHHELFTVGTDKGREGISNVRNLVFGPFWVIRKPYPVKSCHTIGSCLFKPPESIFRLCNMEHGFDAEISICIEVFYSF